MREYQKKCFNFSQGIVTDVRNVSYLCKQNHTITYEAASSNIKSI